MTIKSKMIGCSNEQSVGIKELGNEGELEINKRFYFNSIKSSNIKSIKFKEELIVITTLNTIYTFQEVQND